MITKKCRDCGKEFTLTDGEIEFYRSKGFELPNRCQSCRDKRKKAKNQNTYHNSSGSSSFKQNKYSIEKRSGKSPRLTSILLVAVLVLIVSVSFPNLTKLFNDKTENVTPSVTTSMVETEITTSQTTVSVETETTVTTTETTTVATTDTAEAEVKTYHFRNADRLNEHYEKHGMEMGFSSAAEYEAAASAVVTNESALHKLESEDGDDVYYIESTNEFVIVSTDGYIRTYFYPSNGKAYYDSQ